MYKNNNVIILAKTKIILNYYIDYNAYINIVEKYKNIFLSFTWRKNIMDINFSYNNINKIELDNDDKYNICIVECIKDIFDNQLNKDKHKHIVDLKMKNSKSIDQLLIQKIVDLDYFSYIYFSNDYVSNKINFKNLIECITVIYNNNYYENSCNLPEKLESIIINYNDKKNIIFDIPNELKKIFIKKNQSEFLNFYFTNTNIKKIIVINNEINIKNTPKFLHDYDFLIIKKFFSSNTKYIDFNNLPYTLKILHIYDKIGQSIQPLPNSIEQLKINYYDKNLLENLPCTIKKIHLDFTISEDNIDLFSFLPNSLEEIIIRNGVLKNFTKTINIKLPSRLKILSIQSHYLDGRNFDFSLVKYLIENNIKYTILNEQNTSKHTYIFYRKN